jgi:hypothetical protein
MAMAALDHPDTVFARLAGARDLLDEEQVETLLGLQVLDRMLKRKPRSLAVLAVAEGMLAPEKATDLQQAVRYYLIRQADRAYGRIAVERGILPASLVEGLLEDQRRHFAERKVLQRLSRILLVAGAISPEQDDELKRAVLGREAPAAAVTSS